MLYAITDIETTGRYASANAITEIAIVLHDGEKVVDSFQSLVNPGTTIVPFVSRLTGITNDMVKDAPKFFEIAKKVWEMTEGAVFVAHSVNFDYSLIRQEFKELGADFKRRKLCTVRLSRSVFPGHTSYSLGNICSRLNIDIEHRHRAMGDVLATVKLFEKCLENDGQNHIDKLLKRTSKEAILPPNLSKENFDSLPEKPGVYYFHDEKGKVIYVGKSINIKKRVYSHLTGRGSAKISFVSAIAKITYELCGNELIALLKESDEIHRLFPIYNRVQKFDRGSYILTEYVNQKGVRQLAFGKEHKALKPLLHFRGFDAAREFMNELVESHELCPRFVGLQSTTGVCFNFGLSKCRGVCAGIEDVDTYNERVREALGSLNELQETRVIVDEGRAFNERSVILIENGIYKGFGFTDKSGEISPEMAAEIIEPARQTNDILKILRMWFRGEEYQEAEI